MVFETLESRRLQSVTGFSPNYPGTLIVQGDAGNDTLQVYREGASITVYEDRARIGVFAASTVRSIAMYGNGGNDVLEASSAAGYAISHNVMLSGGDGDDVLRGGFGRDDFYGGRGTDIADYSNRGQALRVSLDGYWNDGTAGSGSDVDNVRTDVENVWGGAGSDYLVGNAAGNYLWGGGGHDRLEGGSGNDRLDGSAGDDVLVGHAGHDALFGQEGNDALYGGPGGDVINAGTGSYNRIDHGDGATRRALYLNFDGGFIPPALLARAGVDWTNPYAGDPGGRRLDADGSGITVSPYFQGRADREILIEQIMWRMQSDLMTFGINVVRVYGGQVVENQYATTLFFGRGNFDGGGHVAYDIDDGNANRTDIAFINEVWEGNVSNTALATNDIALHEAGHTWGLYHVLSGSRPESMGLRYSMPRSYWLQETTFLNEWFQIKPGHGPAGQQNSFQTMWRTFA